MKVVSIPRSGATRFAMDLAKEHSKDYAGELSSRMCLDYDLQSIIKNQYHEAGDGCQPMFTTREFMNTLAEHDIKNVWLVNDHNDVSPHLRNGIFFLRKNYMNCFYSLGEVWHAQQKAGKVYWWSGAWEPYIRNLSLILDWNLQFPSEIYWYEDRYDFTREYSVDKQQIIQEIGPLLEEYNIDEKMKTVLS